MRPLAGEQTSLGGEVQPDPAGCEGR